MNDTSARTVHEDKDPRAGHGFENRLIKEKSPYLLQHARNPVNWYPWGEEAFEKASKEDKPIFLSIGYSTCHWCHVMEKETFEDAEASRLMNEVFVSIKVDREERPDIDHLYMAVCQMMTGGGGWPLNIIMTPTKRPFFAATYIPKDNRLGRIGMIELSSRIKEMWASRRNEVLQSADHVAGALRKLPDNLPGEPVTPGTLEVAHRDLSARFDERFGGYGRAPKFPTPHNMLFLLRYWLRTGDARGLSMVETTLENMRRGGIYDHVGYGFHRYSTDQEWLLPHFEKMLYDQALIAMAYIEAYQATGKEEYGRTAREIFTYVLRDMTSPEGAFYSAEDADSEGVEGRFYVWTADELERVLGQEDARLFAAVYNIRREGNFRDEASGKMSGANILHLREPLSKLAADLVIPEDELRARLSTARQKLFEAREKRVRPFRDDKILVDWNGLMIAALARGAQSFNDPLYARAAGRAADFILNTMRDAKGRLWHRYRDGQAAVPGLVDDYAFLVWGLLDLYEATFDVRYLRAALDLNADMRERFWDPQTGGFYFTSTDNEELLVRKKEIYDGATPSGNSVAALNLLRLSRVTGSPEFERKAEALIKAFAGNVGQLPSAHTQLLIAVEFALGPSYEVVIAGDPDTWETMRMLENLRRSFVPNKVVVLRPLQQTAAEIMDIATYTREQKSKDGKPTAYVCRNFNCDLPTTDPDKMLELLGAKKQ
ncbi:MAG: thioredoxin domain-containing protein [Deltaproteobacteria bacterium]|nr:thioredoxin domain-containing protein [Deltaproteobacteria bacterium]